MINQFMEEIEEKKEIELKQKDQLGGGSHGNVYLYKINKDTVVAVKCFKNQKTAIKEEKNYEDI